MVHRLFLFALIFKEWIILLLKPCSRCGSPVPYGIKYCTKCQPIAEAEAQERIQRSRQASNKRYNKTRDPKYTRFYNSKDWRVLSLSRLQYDNYKCVKCGKIASEVDHIKAIQTPDGWDRRLDFDNTQSLCLECHNKKHNRFIKRRYTTKSV